MKRLDIIRATYDVCRKCRPGIRVVQSYEAHCTKEGQVIFYFKCDCGHHWARNRTPKVELTEMGQRTDRKRKGNRIKYKSRASGKLRPPNIF